MAEPDDTDRSELGPVWKRPLDHPDLSTWPGWQRLDAAAELAHLPVRALRLAMEWLLRWVLRIALPIVTTAAILHAFPYHATVQQVPFRVEATIAGSPGLSANTTFGNWEFPNVDGLPVGLHVTPENVDVLQLARTAQPDVSAYARSLQNGLIDQAPWVLAWLAVECLIGIGFGLLAAALVNMAVRYLRGQARRPDEFRHRLRQLGAAAAVVAVIVGIGALTYNPNWVRQSRLTGTLAAAQLFPGQLSQYYQQRSKAFDVIGSVVGIQGALQAQIDQGQTPDTAFRVMFISDLHLAAVYPLVQQYAQNYGVKLIVNTGDESEFGTRAEMTADYVDSIRALTRTIPMLWIAGNHDSPDVLSIMKQIPGVTVLGDKTATPDGYSVSAGAVDAYGLTIAGVSDPRVYGGPGAYGSNDGATTDALERSAIDSAVKALGAAGKGNRPIDIFATHEPVAAAALRKALPDDIRQTNSGHLHAQNKSGDIQHGSSIDLVEGSTGAGGLDNLVRGAAAPPIEFSIESVAPNCEFTRVLRFQIANPQPSAASPQSYGDDVTVSTVYFRPQKVTASRTCNTDLGISASEPMS